MIDRVPSYISENVTSHGAVVSPSLSVISSTLHLSYNGGPDGVGGGTEKGGGA